MKRAPHVLVSGVVLAQPMGGVFRHNAELLPRAAALLRDGGGSLTLIEGAQGLAFDPGSAVERVRTDVRAWPAWRRALTEASAVRRVAAERRVDLFHTAHLPVPDLAPVVQTLTVHDLRHLDATLSSLPRRLLASALLRRGLRRAGCVITVSDTVRRELGQRFAPARIELLPNAADHLPLHTMERAGGPLLCIGHLEPRKNLPVLYEALARDVGLPRLVLVGVAKGDQEERLARLARQLGIAERIERCAEVNDDELARLYARAACVVLPSRLEGFGLPALEAARAGAPLAVAAAGALPEVAGGDVPSFPPDDAGACARAIRAALATPPETLEQRRGRAAQWTWQAAAERLVALWAELASAP